MIELQTIMTASEQVPARVEEWYEGQKKLNRGRTRYQEVFIEEASEKGVFGIVIYCSSH